MTTLKQSKRTSYVRHPSSEFHEHISGQYDLQYIRDILIDCEQFNSYFNSSLVNDKAFILSLLTYYCQ